ncbi:Uncharacterised protein [Shigella sonnei]|nr:Uncharacterised protein [Shigella sonnei]
MDQRNFRIVGASHRDCFLYQNFAFRGEIDRDENVFISHSVTPSIKLSMTGQLAFLVPLRHPRPANYVRGANPAVKIQC